MARAAVERRIELPRVIVWDALVDDDLVPGWLHPVARLADDASLLEADEPRLLVSSGPVLGAVRISLAEAPGGPRGSSTDLRVELGAEIEPRFAPPWIAAWSTRIDQLEDLLRGHPVDWDTWERDRGGDYAEHLARARAASGG